MSITCVDHIPRKFEDIHMYIYIIYIYRVIDLEVLVRSFNCEDPTCYVRNPRESVFRVRESNRLFAKVLRKLDIISHYCQLLYITCKGLPLLPPGVRQEKGTKEFRFGSGSVPCVILLDIHLSQQPTSPQPNTGTAQWIPMVLLFEEASSTRSSQTSKS